MIDENFHRKVSAIKIKEKLELQENIVTLINYYANLKNIGIDSIDYKILESLDEDIRKLILENI